MAAKGIYTALSGAMAQSARLDSIANNIANVNTPAFKRDQQIFKEYLTANEKVPTSINVPRVPISQESFYDMQGGDQSYVDVIGTHTDFTQGGLKSTGNALDLAIDGEGFFEVSTPQGLRLTRNGSFTMDGNGQLVTKEGYPVLLQAEPGTDPAERAIRPEPGQSLTIAENGELFSGGTPLGRLTVVNVADKSQLLKQGSSLFTFRPNVQAEVTSVANPSLKQGFIESSNVNVVREMTEMISANRAFETTQKAISAYDSINDKLVNVVPKT
jgi:flagellar basal-body rod protein FlgF